MRRAFTLIEFLVIVVVCGIVAVVLFPIFAQAKSGSGHPDPCTSNLKQIFTGSSMYAADWDDHMPHDYAWVDESMPYVKNAATYNCPKLRSVANADWGYAYDDRSSAVVISEMKDPSKIPFVYDSDKRYKNASDLFISPPRSGRHKGLNFAVFADGHLSKLAPPQEAQFQVWK